MAGILFSRCLALLIPILAALLVALLPIGTAVPALIWIPLAAVDVMLIVVLFWFTWTPRAIGATIAGSLVVMLLAVAASQVFAATPPIADAQGRPIPHSIATLEKVNLNGSEQWITIRGKNVNNPVLLYLGMGGPGGGGFATRGLFEPLEEYFVVVSWDEPGTGKSYNAVPIDTLTPQRFVADAHALTQMLRARFHQDKIYVYGVSWTSILGVWLVQQYPDLFYAYIGNGQMVNTTENDVMGYQLALNYLTERGDTAMAETLRRNGPPPYSGEGLVGKYVAYIDVLNDYMGEPRYMLVIPIVPLFAPEYGLVDKVNHTRGLIDSFAVVYPQLKDLDFTTQAAKLDVPVYLLVGRHDVNAMSSLSERYYSVLRAPHKELIWFETGHGLSGENLGQFVDVMVNKVLKHTNPTSR
ncbi:MAG TPA: alpha/beta hydrolase [Roseiflexaceae bacterium]|nr:alpha/beta hydrolase [Roseiflexaceae bacterium]